MILLCMIHGCSTINQKEKKAEVMTLQKISLDEFLRLRKLVYRSARPLDYTKWKFLFENGSLDDFLLVLSSYQNDDGGFGYNIECNNWNPNLSPYTVCIALDYLDTIIDSLLSTHEFRFPSAKELDAYEQGNPHPDGKRWCVAEQTIGNYYWGSNFIIRDLDILRRFDRLDFDLPVVI